MSEFNIPDNWACKENWRSWHTQGKNTHGKTQGEWIPPVSRKSIGFPLWDAETPKVSPAAHPAIAVAFHLHQARKFQSALCLFEAKRVWRIELFISYLVMQNQLNSILCIFTELSGYKKINMEYGRFKQLQIIKLRRSSWIRILHNCTSYTTIHNAVTMWWCVRSL